MTEKNLYEKFGLTEEEADKTKDILPSFNLGKLKDGETADFKLLQSEPHYVEWKDKDTGEERKQLVVTALDLLTGTEIALWLSAKSLRMEFLKLAKKCDGDLKDKTIRVSVRTYKHQQYGTSRGYTVQLKEEVSN